LIGGTEADTDRQRHGIDDIVDGGPIKTDVDDEFVDLESRAHGCLNCSRCGYAIRLWARHAKWLPTLHAWL
jgi:hypothetical protein